MGQDPEVIRREIEQTRGRMDQTVDALGYKADVPSRTREAVSGKVNSVKERITGVAGSVSGRASDVAGSVGQATPSGADVRTTARRGVGLAQENPLGLAIGSIAIGFLAGMLIPESRIENEKLGPMADQVKDQVQGTAQEALEQGKQVAQDVASTAQEHVGDVVQEAREVAASAAQDVKETAQGSATDHAQQVADSARESAQAVREQATGS